MRAVVVAVCALLTIVLAPPAPAAAPEASHALSTCDGAPGYESLLSMAGEDATIPLTGLEGLVRLGTDDLPLGEPSEDFHTCSTTIQPGMRMTSPAGCTMNWVFRDAANKLYIGTAGHCVSFVGQSVSVSGFPNMGTVAYRLCCGQGNDFALVEIDPDLYDVVDPTLCHWGGPNGADFASSGETVLVHGHGLIYGTASPTRPRVGIAQQGSFTTFSYIGFAQPGDSGMPIMAEDGKAAAIHTHSSISAIIIRVDPSPKFGTQVVHAMNMAGAALGTTISIETSTEPVHFPLPV